MVNSPSFLTLKYPLFQRLALLSESSGFLLTLFQLTGVPAGKSDFLHQTRAVRILQRTARKAASIAAQIHVYCFGPLHLTQILAWSVDPSARLVTRPYVHVVLQDRRPTWTSLQLL